MQAQRCLRSARSYANTARTKLRLANAEGAALLERGRSGARPAPHSSAGSPSPTARSLPALTRTARWPSSGLRAAALLAKKPVAARNYARASAGTRSVPRRSAAGAWTRCSSWHAASVPSAHTERAASILRGAASLIEQVPIDELDAEQRATWLATQHARVRRAHDAVRERSGGNDEPRAWQAFEVSERGRARSLRYAMSQATDTRAMSSSEPASARYRELMRRITELGPRRGGSGGAPRFRSKRWRRWSSSSAPTPPDAIARRAPAHDSPRSTQRGRIRRRRDDMFAFVINGEHIRVCPPGRPRAKSPPPPTACTSACATRKPRATRCPQRGAAAGGARAVAAWLIW